MNNKADKKTSGRGRKPAGRGKGKGTLQKHGKFYRAVWVVNGQVFRRSTGTADKKEAENRLAAFVAPYYAQREAKKDIADARRAKGEGYDEAAAAVEERARERREMAGRMLVPLSGAWAAFDGSLSRRSVSSEVNRIYASRWGVFMAWMEKNRPAARSLVDVDAETARAFMRGIRARFSPKTFNDYRVLLSQVWKVLDKDAGLQGFNPWREIVPLPKDTHTRRELSVDELKRVTGSLTGELRTLFALGIYTGMRLGDCIGLKWEKVEWERPPYRRFFKSGNPVEGFIQLKPHKTAKVGTMIRFPVFPELAAILKETPARNRRGFILPELAEEYSEHAQYACERVKKAFEAAGIETQADTARKNPKSGKPRKAVEVGFHSLRHTFVSLCANAGIPLHIVQAIVGHTNAAMTAHYFHVSDDALIAAVGALPYVFTADTAAAPVAALPAPAGPVEVGAGGRAKEAVAAFKTACAGLVGAGLTARDWEEVTATLAAVEQKERV